MTPIPFLARHWKLIAIGVAIAILIGRGDYYRIDRNHWRAVAGVLRIDLDSIKNAQAAATQIAEAKMRAEQAQFSELAERADNAERQISGLRAAADRYANANRVRSKAAGGASGRTSGASAGEAAQSGDGPGGDASVAVSRADFDTLVEHSIRLKQVHEWGDSLVAAGLAVKAE